MRLKRNGTLCTGVTWGPPRRLAIFTVYETRRGPYPLRPHSCARHRMRRSNKRRRVSGISTGLV
ncbi:hypothetical protein F2981_13835 [Sinorhizobium meliloti]|nr:hypothetical protein [Sinorhizobium meliloti]